MSIGSNWIQNADKAPNIPLGENVRSRIQQFSLMNKFKKKVIRVSYLTIGLSSLPQNSKYKTFYSVFIQSNQLVAENLPCG